MAIQEDLTCGEGGSTGAVVLDRINGHEHEIGDLPLLTTTVQTDLVSAVNEVNAAVLTNDAEVGDLTLLTTTVQTDLVSAVNEVNAEVLTNDADIATNTADILALQGQIGLPSKGSMRLEGDLVQVIGDTYETMECFNAVSSERGEVLVTARTVGSIQYTGTEIDREAELHYGINADFASNEEIEVVPYLNGVEYSDDPITLRGLGNGKPVSFFWISQVTLQPDDIITLMARSSITNDITVTFQRTVLAMKIDG